MFVIVLIKLTFLFIHCINELYYIVLKTSLCNYFLIQPVAVSVTRLFNKHVSIFAIQSKNLRFNTFA